MLLSGIKGFPSNDVHCSYSNLKINLLAESLVVLLWTYSSCHTLDGPLALLGWWTHLLIFLPQQVTSALKDPWLSLWIFSMQSQSRRLSEYANMWPFWQIVLRWTRLPRISCQKCRGEISCLSVYLKPLWGWALFNQCFKCICQHFLWQNICSAVAVTLNVENMFRLELWSSV